ncbi:hypothetical protein FB567DRAFT_581071 [Paraphoma chrysanthemicola]|uniref:Uncharacterized protein n=1 Tax=Paraphoma chrysanthemicola TaxID=798071 RepID=A0A8K0R603_9PLEO|nr:hypothetical protein FB567DRAFT_581071 [Paraphoma chrysanthemicola]
MTRPSYLFIESTDRLAPLISGTRACHGPASDIPTFSKLPLLRYHDRSYIRLSEETEVVHARAVAAIGLLIDGYQQRRPRIDGFKKLVRDIGARLTQMQHRSQYWYCQSGQHEPRALDLVRRIHRKTADLVRSRCGFAIIASTSVPAASGSTSSAAPLHQSTVSPTASVDRQHGTAPTATAATAVPAVPVVPAVPTSLTLRALPLTDATPIAVTPPIAVALAPVPPASERDTQTLRQHLKQANRAKDKLAQRAAQTKWVISGLNEQIGDMDNRRRRRVVIGDEDEDVDEDEGSGKANGERNHRDSVIRNPSHQHRPADASGTMHPSDDPMEVDEQLSGDDQPVDIDRMPDHDIRDPDRDDGRGVATSAARAPHRRPDTRSRTNHAQHIRGAENGTSEDDDDDGCDDTRVAPRRIDTDGGVIQFNSDEDEDDDEDDTSIEAQHNDGVGIFTKDKSPLDVYNKETYSQALQWARENKQCPVCARTMNSLKKPTDTSTPIDLHKPTTYSDGVHFAKTQGKCPLCLSDHLQKVHVAKESDKDTKRLVEQFKAHVDNTIKRRNGSTNRSSSC